MAIRTSKSRQRRAARDLLIVGINARQIQEVFRAESGRKGKGRIGYVRVAK